MKKEHWYDKYKKLSLYGGVLTAICDDDEDMLVIEYDNGMLIDVGYVADKKCYFITVVAENTAECWNNPVECISVTDKECLFDTIQSVIFRNRK